MAAVVLMKVVTSVPEGGGAPVKVLREARGLLSRGLTEVGIEVKAEVVLGSLSVVGEVIV